MIIEWSSILCKRQGSIIGQFECQIETTFYEERILEKPVTRVVLVVPWRDLKKIEWVSLIDRWSSRTRVGPEAEAD